MYATRFLRLAWILAILSCEAKEGKVAYFNVGVMFPIVSSGIEVSDGVVYMAAMEMAINEINDKFDGVHDNILPLTELRMVAKNPIQTFGGGAIAAAQMLEVDEGRGVVGVVGPAALATLQGNICQRLVEQSLSI